MKTRDPGPKNPNNPVLTNVLSFCAMDPSEFNGVHLNTLFVSPVSPQYDEPVDPDERTISPTSSVLQRTGAPLILTTAAVAVVVVGFFKRKKRRGKEVGERKRGVRGQFRVFQVGQTHMCVCLNMCYASAPSILFSPSGGKRSVYRFGFRSKDNGMTGVYSCLSLSFSFRPHFRMNRVDRQSS